MEYFEARAHGRVIAPSKLFLYQTTLESQGTTDDMSAGLRTTLKALARCGTPPAVNWPYRPEKLAQELTGPFLSSFSGDYRSIRYVRLDDAESSAGEVLLRVKAFLAAGFPSAFGFSVPNSLSREPDILFRPTIDALLGAQAAVAVGYDDKKYVHSQKPNQADATQQQQAGEKPLQLRGILGLFSYGPGLKVFGARVGDVFEEFLFVSCVALYRLNEVGDQIETPDQNVFHLGPPLLDGLVEPYGFVVSAPNDKKTAQQNSNENKQYNETRSNLAVYT